MDLFDWKKLNSNIQLLDTKKKFFNQYYYNIKYFCPGGRLILCNSADNIEAAVSARHELDRSYNYGGSWRVRRTVNQIDVVQLTAMQAVTDAQPNLKVRIEEPNLTFYSIDQEPLVQIANQLNAYTHNIISVSRPAGQHVIDQLKIGAILVKKDPGYQYKVFCKEGMCSNKRAVYNYLDCLGDQIKLSTTVRKNLSRAGEYVWGVWFYTNEPNIADMLNIIEPNFVANIHRVAVV